MDEDGDGLLDKVKTFFESSLNACRSSSSPQTKFNTTPSGSRVRCSIICGAASVVRLEKRSGSGTTLGGGTASKSSKSTVEC